MKELNTILHFYKSYNDNSQHRCAIAQVVRVEKSSYRREGARMLVFETGVFQGGISGGCLEGDALKRAQIAILKNKPSLVTYDTSKENEVGIGLGCNGIIDVLITPLTGGNNLVNLLERCLSNRQPHILITITDSNSDSNIYALGSCYYYDVSKNILEHVPTDLAEKLIPDIKAVLVTKKSQAFSYTLNSCSVQVFIELLLPPIHIALFGNNYDVYPMLELAAVMGWETSLVGKIKKLKSDKLKSVAHIYDVEDNPWPEFDARTAVILMAHDYRTDLKHLAKALQSSAAYIACLGPRTRFEKMITDLGNSNHVLSKTDLGRIHAPCGLDIGANNPEEIALSVFSEIVSVFAEKKGGFLKDKKGPIHDRF